MEVEFCTAPQGRSQRGIQGARAPLIEMLFQIFKLNFSWNMSKLHCFSNKFSKITKPLNLQYW